MAPTVQNYGPPSGCGSTARCCTTEQIPSGAGQRIRAGQPAKATSVKAFPSPAARRAPPSPARERGRGNFTSLRVLERAGLSTSSWLGLSPPAAAQHRHHRGNVANGDGSGPSAAQWSQTGGCGRAWVRVPAARNHRRGPAKGDSGIVAGFRASACEVEMSGGGSSDTKPAMARSARRSTVSRRSTVPRHSRKAPTAS